MVSHSNDLPDDFYKYIATAVAFAVGLAWNHAFVELLHKIPFLHTTGPFLYAIVLTLLAYFILKALKGGLIRAEQLNRDLMSHSL